MKTYMTYVTGLVAVAVIIGVGVLKTAGLLDNDTANTAVSFVIGLGAGGAAGIYGRRP